MSYRGTYEWDEKSSSGSRKGVTTEDPGKSAAEATTTAKPLRGPSAAVGTTGLTELTATRPYSNGGSGSSGRNDNNGSGGRNDGTSYGAGNRNGGVSSENGSSTPTKRRELEAGVMLSSSAGSFVTQKRMTFKEATAQLPEKRLKYFLRCFRRADTNENDRICVRELGTVMRWAGANPSDYELKQIIHHYDLNLNGTIEVTEFIPLMASAYFNQDAADRCLYDAFKLFDFSSGTTGFIPASELRRIMLLCGEPLSPDEVDRLLRLVDTDHNGLISTEELAATLTTPLPEEFDATMSTGGGGGSDDAREDDEDALLAALLQGGSRQNVAKGSGGSGLSDGRGSGVNGVTVAEGTIGSNDGLVSDQVIHCIRSFVRAYVDDELLNVEGLPMYVLEEVRILVEPIIHKLVASMLEQIVHPSPEELKRQKREKTDSGQNEGDGGPAVASTGLRRGDDSSRETEPPTHYSLRQAFQVVVDTVSAQERSEPGGLDNPFSGPSFVVEEEFAEQLMSLPELRVQMAAAFNEVVDNARSNFEKYGDESSGSPKFVMDQEDASDRLLHCLRASARSLLKRIVSKHDLEGIPRSSIEEMVVMVEVQMLEVVAEVLDEVISHGDADAMKLITKLDSATRASLHVEYSEMMSAESHVQFIQLEEEFSAKLVRTEVIVEEVDYTIKNMLSWLKE